MLKKIKKTLALLMLVTLLPMTLAACGGEKLDQVQDKSTTEETADTAEDTAEDKAEEKTEAKTEEKAEEEEFFDVDDVEGKEDYSKYDEKKGSEAETTAKVQNGGVEISDGTGEEDQYHTEPVPEGQQKPVDEQHVNKDNELSCYLTISCATILDNKEDLTEGKEMLVPDDGILMPRTKVTFYEGETVFDILKRETRNNRIHLEYSFTPMYNSNYIEAIGNLYEFDCGKGSGWMFCVNDWYPNYGCSRYVVQDGDEIQWNYTCDLGVDLGQSWMG